MVDLMGVTENDLTSAFGYALSPLAALLAAVARRKWQLDYPSMQPHLSDVRVAQSPRRRGRAGRQ
ncbi:MAG: hypothetical protein DLM58_12115 [Pseudonocardiales bacterium]|nr:MAG: hypothetical protein DLM58_12115 [Pseudonocardiales bacterium]